MKKYFIAIGIISLSTFCNAETINFKSEAQKFDNIPSVIEILDKTIMTYKNMKSYASEGAVIYEVSDSEPSSRLTSAFSVKLAKPMLYQIIWETMKSIDSNMNIKSAIWNSGDGSHFYKGWSGEVKKMDKDTMAFAYATGISSGIAYIIPTLFFGDNNNIIAHLKNPILKGSEHIDGKDCFVIKDESKGITLWISENEHLILQYSKIYYRDEKLNLNNIEKTIDDGSLAQAFKDMGEELTDAKIEEMRKNIEEAIRIGESVEISHKSVHVHMHKDIVVDKEFNKDDLEFNVDEIVEPAKRDSDATTQVEIPEEKNKYMSSDGLNEGIYDDNEQSLNLDDYRLRAKE